MHPYYKNFIESQKILNNDKIQMDLETESHLLTYLLQNQKLPGKFKSRDFNPSYNLQDSMDLLEYIYPEYYLETNSKKNEHTAYLKATPVTQRYVRGDSKNLPRAIFMALVEDFHQTFQWPTQ